MHPTQDVIILPFQPENQAEVKNLILAGLAEHWGMIDPSKNPDLNDIVRPMPMQFFSLPGIIIR